MISPLNSDLEMYLMPVCVYGIDKYNVPYLQIAQNMNVDEASTSQINT